MSGMESYSSSLAHLSEIPEQGGILRNKLQMNNTLLSSITDRKSHFTKTLPSKSLSFQTSFRSSSAGSFLPEFTESDQTLSKTQHANTPLTFRASQKGRRDILPTIIASKSEGYASDQGWNAQQPLTYKASEKGRSELLPTTSPARIDGYTSDQSRNNRYHPLTNIKTISQKLLRRRTASTDALLVSDDSAHRRNSGGKMSLSFDSHHNHHHHNNSSGKYYHNGFRKLGSNLWRLLAKSDVTQILIFCCVFYVVYDSYVKLVATSGQLQKLREDEGMMLLHLQRLEQQSIQVHESMAKIGDKANSGEYHHDSSTGSNLDEAQIHAQTQQLYEMEQELDHELRSLQEKLQQAARTAITTKYGDGPIKVVLEIEMPDETENSSNTVSILLWYDTPHAAWTWLRQIIVGEWDGSEFKVGDLTSIDAQPIIYNAGKLDFLEKSKKSHEPWTVGLSNNEGNLNMFINLKDNSEDRHYAVCVGKVIDGFDVIQKMLGASQKDDTRPIRIHSATAALLTRDAKSQPQQQR